MRARRAVLLVGALLLCASVPAHAELRQEGNLVVAFDGGLAPKTLPRRTPAPVAVRVAGDIKVTAGTALPQLRQITVAINSAGRLDDNGLATCRVKAIQPATEAEAHRVCGDAVVGSGHVTVGVRIPNQAPFSVAARLLAFNGPRRHGSKLILAQVYAKAPPGAFILPFVVKRRHGLFGTTISTTLPASAQGWAYLTHFDMTLERRYRFHGKRHSYISAACAAPAGFPGAVFPFAKATYGFDNGQRLSTTVSRTCRVSKE